MAQRKVSIRDAKIQLGQLLRDIYDNVEVTITCRGKPVGMLIPVHQEVVDLPEWIRKKEKEGVLERPKSKKPRGFPPALPVPGTMAQKFLEEDRAE